MLESLSKDTEPFKGKVIVIRYEGPKGGPGMPEMLTPTSAIMGAGLGEQVDPFLIHSFCVVHTLHNK